MLMSNRLNLLPGLLLRLLRDLVMCLLQRVTELIPTVSMMWSKTMPCKKNQPTKTIPLKTPRIVPSTMMKSCNLKLLRGTPIARILTSVNWPRERSKNIMPRRLPRMPMILVSVQVPFLHPWLPRLRLRPLLLRAAVAEETNKISNEMILEFQLGHILCTTLITTASTPLRSERSCVCSTRVCLPKKRRISLFRRRRSRCWKMTRKKKNCRRETKRRESISSMVLENTPWLVLDLPLMMKVTGPFYHLILLVMCWEGRLARMQNYPRTTEKADNHDLKWGCMIARTLLMERTKMVLHYLWCLQLYGPSRKLNERAMMWTCLCMREVLRNMLPTTTVLRLLETAITIHCVRLMKKRTQTVLSFWARMIRLPVVVPRRANVTSFQSSLQVLLRLVLLPRLLLLVELAMKVLAMECTVRSMSHQLYLPAVPTEVIVPFQSKTVMRLNLTFLPNLRRQWLSTS
mmetsp:Transcript_11849/g.26086  ORF Transcript_11849/g.26086 Transcript_11849/m.26086 type:complete len:459 (-) Transcript_11849:3326-4702(-)